jgi:hypothetical protein
MGGPVSIRVVQASYTVSVRPVVPQGLKSPIQENKILLPILSGPSTV